MEQNNHSEANGNLEKKVEHILITKVQFWVSILVFMVPIIGFFFKIQLDIALIKQNHEAHMQVALEKIAKLEEEEKEIFTQINTNHEAIIRLLQMHGK